jgi:hypothetical protein
MSGRPSAEFAAVRARALTDPDALLNDLGVEIPNIKDPTEFLEDVYKQMITGAGGAKGAALLQDFFKNPDIVSAPQKKKKGLVIELRQEARNVASKAGETRKILRTYAFWFSSVAIAIKSKLKPEAFRFLKFQYSKARGGILIYDDRQPWKNL